MKSAVHAMLQTEGNMRIWNVMSLKKGQVADNGATPWYSVLRLGSERQQLKFAIDTGTTHSWVTSIQCTTDAGMNHQRFDFRSSTSFAFVTSPYDPTHISFGPWGTLQASLGRDLLRFRIPGGDDELHVPDYMLYMGQNYDGQQFRDLVWDGAIGVPAQTPVSIDSSELIQQLMNWEDAHFPAKNRALRFDYTQNVLQIVDMSMPATTKHLVTARISNGGILAGLWVVDNVDVAVNGSTVASPVSFCLDTGSSRFKGDPKIIDTIVRVITRGGTLPTYVAGSNPDFSIYPDMVLTVAKTPIRVRPEQYFEKLADNYYKLAFHEMAGLDGILLAGSTFLEHHSPLFFFEESDPKNSTPNMKLNKYTGVGVGLSIES